MPNLNNIASPIILIAPGRSGTSLISALFERHPDVNFVGETANLVFGIWHAIEFSSTNIRPLFQEGHWLSVEERASLVVRQAFLTCFPDEKAYWFQKPLGIPVVLSIKFDESQWNEAAEWYWRVMRHSFPGAKYFTILRHPADVVLSSQSYWGYDEEALWWSLGFLAFLLAHPSSPVDYAIRYEDLFEKGDKVARSLFDYLGIPFHENVLEAFSQVHTPSKGRENLSQISPTRCEEWSRLDPAKALPKYTIPIEALYARFGCSLQWPAHFVEREVQEETQEQDTATIQALSDTISTLHRRIEQLHLDYRKKFLDREREFYQIWTEQQAWIAELEKGKAWLEEQRDNWQRIAEERERIIQEQQAWIGELEQGKAWLEEQRDNWQRIAEERERIIQEQQAWIGELEQGKAWLEEQWRTWQRIAEEKEATIQQQEAVIRRVDEYLTRFRQKPLIRFAIRLGLLRLEAD